MTQPTRTTWAMPVDVLSLTGIADATDAEVVQANAIIEIIGGRLYTTSADRTGRKDTEWLRRAVAYQVPWMRAQPDFFERLDLATLEGLELKELALILAPMTRLVLNRLSWRRTRSLHVRSTFQDGPGPVSSNPLAEVNDAYESWTPLGGG
ncbi:hypothetical protein [Lentzea guizhouensis]|nr:hypothetical protein [Lentzea guizhouensis]